VVTGYCFRRCGVWISFDSVVTDLGYDCVMTRHVWGVVGETDL
jgi:hypothetical protein